MTSEFACSCCCASGSVAGPLELEFFNPSCFRRENTNQLNPVTPEDVSILKSIRKPESVVLRVYAADTRCERSLTGGEMIDTRLRLILRPLPHKPAVIFNERFTAVDTTKGAITQNVPYIFLLCKWLSNDDVGVSMDTVL